MNNNKLNRQFLKDQLVTILNELLKSFLVSLVRERRGFLLILDIKRFDNFISILFLFTTLTTPLIEKTDPE